MKHFFRSHPSLPIYSAVIIGVLFLCVAASKMMPSMAKGTDFTFAPVNLTNQSADQDVVRYLTYSPQAFAQLNNRRRVLFFDANWCSTCKDADQNLSLNADKIPRDVTVFKVDFDTAKDLKQKYGVTVQHTFVQVDARGERLQIWNGGGITELLAQLK